ncbi:tetraacyldisaccharide 4'-kinase [Roseivirga sp. E12]|uniref:tetraacyldisaccharide 4'-kinase n=1 Tax=Roseivirga sp. E12 TaxID=2819237 RepID=UPI001ABBFA5D|nr:tetraacyldisaccharide 4'-kinase [Roseivirga sp. E12]MBO3700487.1 tetraacyldisaccharide 4'-kinase [Roseivirga sp. E12]
MKFIRALFFPFSVLYGWLMQARNRQFDNGQRSQTAFDRTIISVGNLSTGGTGKTPMIEFLIKSLKDEYRLATISRGYGRRTKGFIMASDADDAKSIGDEPLQFYHKFGQDITVSVCEERILAVPSVLMEKDDVEVFLLDDAYQHRKVARDHNILLSDYQHPFYQDFVLPAGNLREPRIGAKRADAIVITKCPELGEQEKEVVISNVRKYNDISPIYFSHIAYQDVRSVFGKASIPREIALLTGVAKAQPIAKHLSKSYLILKHLEYADHYNFRSSDLDEMTKVLAKIDVTAMVTTEKDMVRLLPFKSHPMFEKIDLFYLPIEFRMDREDDFLSDVIKVIQRGKR